MEKIRYILLGLLIVSGAAVGAEPVGRPDKGVVTLFQDALYQEQTAGDLDKAIELYQQVLAESAEVERLAARATFQLGVCYLKKGDKEKAAEYFGKVVSDYPAQKELATKAQKQLEKIAPSAGKPSGDYVIHYKAVDQSKEAIDLLNGIMPQGVRTFRARQYRANGQTIDTICTDANESKDKLVEAINSSGELRLVKVESPAQPSEDYIIHYKAVDQTQNPLELLNKIHPKDVQTFRYKAYQADGEKLARICTDSEVSKDKLVEVINNSDTLKLVKVELPEKKDSASTSGTEKGKIVELALDDGKSAGRESIGGSGHSVRFENPGGSCFLKAVRIYGARYGVDQPPQEDFHIYICDENFGAIADFAFPYSKFQKGDKNGKPKGWVSLTIDRTQMPAELPSKFFICVDFKPEKTKGVYVHHDAANSGNSYIALPGQELKPFDSGDWMIRAVVEQKGDVAAESSKAGKPLSLEAAPWVDGEVMRLGLATPAGMDIGEIIYTAKTEQADGAPVWVIESYMNVPISHNTQQYTLVRAEAESLKPSMGITNNDMGRFSAVYGDNKVDLTVTKRDSKKTQTLTSQQTVYDNEQALYLIRRMPLSEGYSGSFYLFHMQSASASKFQIDVKGKERRTVAAGTFDCWKVTLAGYVGTFKGVEHTLWFSADEHKYLVRYDSEQAIVELKEATVKSDRPAPLTFDDVGFELPAGWFAMKNPAVGGYKLGVQLIPPGMESWGLLAGFERIPMMDSARMVADMHIEQLKGFFKNYTVREQSRQDLTIDGMQVASYVADYIDEGDKVEYQAYVLGAGVYWFVFRTDKDKFDEQKPGFDAIVKSFKIEEIAAGPSHAEAEDTQTPESTIKSFVKAVYHGNLEAARACVSQNGHDYDEFKEMLATESNHPFQAMIKAMDINIPVEITSKSIQDGKCKISWYFTLGRVYYYGETKVEKGTHQKFSSYLELVGDKWLIRDI